MKKKKNLKTKLVVFRLTTSQHKLLVETFRNQPMSYVKGENALARKIVCDYLAGRLEFTNPAHRKLDVDAHALALVSGTGYLAHPPE
jgi:hypothetical protein